MAQVVITKLDEGPANLVLHVLLQSDGASGELVNELIISPAMLDPPLDASPHLIVMEVWYGMVWFDITLLWGDLVPRPFLVLSRDSGEHSDYHRFGGLPDKGQSPPAGENGNLLISTNGFGQAGSQGSLVIEFRKR